MKQRKQRNLINQTQKASWLRRSITRALGRLMLLSSTALLLAVAPIAHAAAIPTVLFNGTAQTFTFQNVTTNVDSAGDTVPDLFSSLKSIVPGDSITQDIILSVQKIPNDQQVTIYLQAESENDDYNTLLESATLQVVHDGEEITQSLADPVALGVFDSAATKETAVTLTIPVSVGNEISGLSANIDWVFSAEYAPETQTSTGTTSTTPSSTATTSTSTNTSSPKTGDASFIWLWGALGFFFSLVSFLLFILLLRKK